MRVSWARLKIIVGIRRSLCAALNVVLDVLEPILACATLKAKRNVAKNHIKSVGSHRLKTCFILYARKH